MKKSLIALAAFAATSAFAQSSVTLYGIVEATADIGYSKVTNTVVTNAAGVVTANTRAETKNNFRIQDGSDQGTGTSRIGFRGTEDLGGGMKANFLMEMGIRIDDGCVTLGSTAACANGGGSAESGGAVFGRNAWGGISGGFGEVRLGRQVLGSFGVQANSWSAGSSLGLYDAGAGTAPAMGGVRFSNAIRYLSPTMGGFKASVMLAAPETGGPTSTANTLTGVTSTANRRTGVDLALEYANGPAYVGFGYNLRDAGNNTNTGAGTSVNVGKITGYTLGGSYDLGVVKPFLNITRENTKAGGVAAGVVTDADTTARAWSVGLRAPIGAITVIAGVGRVVTSNVTTATLLPNATSEAKRNAYQIGAQYALSKRTLLEANYGQNKLNSTAVSNALVTTRINDKVSALNVGLKHSF